MRAWWGQGLAIGSGPGPWKWRVDTTEGVQVDPTQLGQTVDAASAATCSRCAKHWRTVAEIQALPVRDAQCRLHSRMAPQSWVGQPARPASAHG